jgi:hypothetical protein
MPTKSKAPVIEDEEDELTPDQRRTLELAKRSDAEIRAGVVLGKNGSSSNGGGKASLEECLGQGPYVTIGTRQYMAAPVTYGRRREWQSKIQQLHKLLFYACYANVPKDGAVADFDHMASMLNAEAQLFEADAAKEENREPAELTEITAERVKESFGRLYIEMTDEFWEAAAEAIVLPLQRHHPTLSAAQIIDDLDIPSIVRILHQLLTVSSGVRENFSSPLG